MKERKLYKWGHIEKEGREETGKEIKKVKMRDERESGRKGKYREVKEEEKEEAKNIYYYGKGI